jgi:hypothetical protein
MNQRVLFLSLHLYSKGQALYFKTTSKKLPSQISWFYPNQPARLQFDIITAYQNSTRRSVLSPYPIYNIRRFMMEVVYKLAESLGFVAAKRYQNSTKASNLVLLKSIYHRGNTACYDKELKMIS